MTDKSEISRRALFSGACAILALSSLGSLPVAANATVKKLGKGRVSVRLRDIPELAEVGGSVSIGNVKGKPVAITRTGASSYIAFSLNCPHNGVKVSREGSGWKCNAHGSEFEADGDLVLGPATKRLTRVPIKVSRGVATIG